MANDEREYRSDGAQIAKTDGDCGDGTYTVLAPKGIAANENDISIGLYR